MRANTDFENHNVLFLNFHFPTPYSISGVRTPRPHAGRTGGLLVLFQREELRSVQGTCLLRPDVGLVGSDS